ncbi:MAG TPA: ATP-binding protein [Planctomycetaceae bacterium]|nr:ATP-binding protein [Planctomycetaceae bacterium]
MPVSSKRRRARDSSGKLRIGDDWNAINIIALSQSNPLKAVAEFVENSIDARAKQVTIIRGRTSGQSYLKIIDDGEGVPLDGQGRPNFEHVATHICDSLKREMKARGIKGVQGEFGIGLLSFWTVGETLSLVSTGADGQTYELRMAKGDPRYSVAGLRRLISRRGVELTVRPLLAGIRQFSGEKLQWYLASELRDRIRSSGVEIVIVDRQARLQYRVEPRQFSGQLLHRVPAVKTGFGEVYVELYQADASPENSVGLYRSGTRVMANLADLAELNRPPWTTGCLQGVIDAPFLNVTPGTRLGVLHDERFAEFTSALVELEKVLGDLIRQQQRAAEERTNRDTLKTIQRAFREALLALPVEEYDWFQGYGVSGLHGKQPPHGRGVLSLVEPSNGSSPAGETLESGGANATVPQRAFFEHAGPLYTVRVAPATCVVPVGKTKTFRAIPRDRAGREIEDGIGFAWRVTEGEAVLVNADRDIVTLTAPAEPQLLKLSVCASQEERRAEAEALVTVTDSLMPDRPKTESQRGLPEYTFEKHCGALWRSRYDAEQNVIVINKGHRDFVYAARSKALKLRYICRLFTKELVLHNFPGYRPAELLERMIELSLYTEDNLR